MIRVVCPSCRQTLKAPPEAAGKKGKCHRCGHHFAIPNRNPEPCTATHDRAAKSVEAQEPQAVQAQNRCPVCGLSYGWDGTNCNHCHGRERQPVDSCTPAIDLNKVSIPESIKAIVPELTARLNVILPVGQEDGKLHVFMPDPNNLDAIQKLEFEFGRSIKASYAPLNRIVGAINRCYRTPDEYRAYLRDLAGQWEKIESRIRASVSMPSEIKQDMATIEQREDFEYWGSTETVREATKRVDKWRKKCEESLKPKIQAARRAFEDKWSVEIDEMIRA